MGNDEFWDLVNFLVEQLHDVAAQEVTHESLLQVDPEVFHQAVEIKSVLSRGLLRSRLSIGKLLLNLSSVELLIEQAGTFVQYELLKIRYGHESALLLKSLDQARVQHCLVFCSLLK